MKIGAYEITNIKAVAECDAIDEVQNALFVNSVNDELGDGNCLLFNWTEEDFEEYNEYEREERLVEALQSEHPTSDYCEVNGIYYEGRELKDLA